MTMPTPNQTTPDEPERARGETPEQIAARVAEKFCVLTKQADSTQEYLTRLISEELTKERSVYEEIIRDDCEEFEANEKRIADLSAETTRLAEALKEAREALELCEAALKAVAAHGDMLPRDLVIACKNRAAIAAQALTQPAPISGAKKE